MDPSSSAISAIETTPVSLTIPAAAAWVRVARLAASGVAAPLGLGLDDIEDLKLAIGEACGDRLEVGAAERTLTVRFHASGTELIVEVEGDSPDPPAGSEAGDGEGYALALMEAVTDGVVRICAASGRTVIRMTKTLSPVADADPASAPPGDMVE